MAKGNRFIKDIIYTLRREFGQLVDYYQRVSISPDYALGKPGIQERKYSLPQVPVLAGTMHREFLYNLSFIAANKNFTYGMFLDEEFRTIIVDNKYIHFTPTLNDFVIIKNFRYKIKDFVQIEDDNFTVFVVNHLNNQPLDPIYSFVDKMYITEVSS